MKQYAEAETALKHAIQIRPSAAAYSNLGTVYYYGLHDFKSSARMFEQAAALNDGDYRWWRNAAATYFNAGEKENATRNYEKAIEVGERERSTNSQSQPLLIGLADCYAMTGQAGRALEYVRQAMAGAPLDSNQMAAVGEVYEELGQRA